MCLRPTMRKVAKGPMPLRSAILVSVSAVCAMNGGVVGIGGM